MRNFHQIFTDQLIDFTFPAVDVEINFVFGFQWTFLQLTVAKLTVAKISTCKSQFIVPHQQVEYRNKSA